MDNKIVDALITILIGIVCVLGLMMIFIVGYGIWQYLLGGAMV